MQDANLDDSFYEVLEEKIQKIKELSLKDLEDLSKDLRTLILKVTTTNGGHLSSNLGVVDLTLMLYKHFDFPKDSLIFDVSHQSYTHKILSGRLREFYTLRKEGGLSGFTNPRESIFDLSHVAHAGTAISTGMAISYAKKRMNDPSFTISLVGDASIANGVSFEALNAIRDMDLGPYIIILNDNQMSISPVVGGFSRFLTHVINHPVYYRSKRRMKKVLRKFGKTPHKIFVYFLNRLRVLIYSNYFDSFGIRYIGPIDGHNYREMRRVFKRLSESSYRFDRPHLLHILTLKGKGVWDSEENPEKTHGISPKLKDNTSHLMYTQIFGKKILEMKEKYKNIVATTAAMPKGTGLEEFAQKYPKDFFDVGIAESHAVVFSSFLTYKNTYKPYIAIYSTFFQRALDQVFQDVCLQQNTPVFILDRAGLVGEDGETHHGVFDIAYLKAFPSIILCSPIGPRDLELFLEWSYSQKESVVIRFPKAFTFSDHSYDFPLISKGKGYFIHKESSAKGVLLFYGPLFQEFLDIKESLPPLHIVNLRFAKPLDTTLLEEIFSLNLPIITLEEHALIGGVGESIKSFALDAGHKGKIMSLGIPDSFVPHGTRKMQLELVGLSGVPLKEKILEFLNKT